MQNAKTRGESREFQLKLNIQITMHIWNVQNVQMWNVHYIVK